MLQNSPVHRSSEKKMIVTTHIAAPCLLTVCTIQSGADDVPKLLAVTGGSLVLHLILDIVPHGFIATPDTIFRKIAPTVIELIPGPLILIASIVFFGNPILFLTASFFGLIPDLCTVLFCWSRESAVKLPFVLLIHRLHRKVHWFETEHPDGSVSTFFPNNMLLALEAVFIICILTVLFKQNIT